MDLSKKRMLKPGQTTTKGGNLGSGGGGNRFSYSIDVLLGKKKKEELNVEEEEEEEEENNNSGGEDNSTNGVRNTMIPLPPPIIRIPGMDLEKHHAGKNRQIRATCVQHANLCL